MLYLGAAAGTTVSHVSDIVGPSGCVYAVEFAHRPGRDLINMAKSRTNVIPIIEDARHPLKYRMLVGMVDAVFADVAQPDQVRLSMLSTHARATNKGLRLSLHFARWYGRRDFRRLFYGIRISNLFPYLEQWCRLRMRST